jgi:hypothetical protein
MFRLLRPFIFLLLTLALVGGNAAGRAQAAACCTTASSPERHCHMEMSAAGETKPMAPCDGTAVDCIKHLACAPAPAIPSHVLIDQSTASFGAIDYWTSSSKLASLDHIPEPLPPRSI